jgi:hypothetical protein
MRRGSLTAILALTWMTASAPSAMAQFNIGPGTFGSPGPAATTTVKSSKSNTSDRMGGGGGTHGAARATTVKSSKSNTSDRMGGGGGAKGAGGGAKAINLNSSRSNTP